MTKTHALPTAGVQKQSMYYLKTDKQSQFLSLPLEYQKSFG